MKRFAISGERIKFLRETNNLTQKNVAAFLGVDQSLITRVEKGERTLSVDLVEKLASLFGVHLSAFDKDSDEMPLAYSLRGVKPADTDMVAISAINRIALNCEQLTSLLKEAGIDNDS